MRIAIRQLEAYNRLATNGARQAARALSQMVGIRMTHDVTDVSLITDEALSNVFAGRRHVAVQVGLSGGLSGETVLIFDPDSVDQLRERLRSKGGRSSLAGGPFAELGNIMIGGFIDGWANHIDAQIDVTPPTYIEATGTRILPKITRQDAAETGVFLFKSELAAIDRERTVPIYLIPEYSEFVDLLEARSDRLSVPAEKLVVFDGFATRSAERASRQIAQMTGLPTDVSVSQLRFMSFADIAADVGDDPYVSAVFELNGSPSGFFVALFGERSADRIASAMLPDGIDPGGEMADGAITELGNIITSGFIDGWANTLDSSIEHTPPELVRDSGQNIVRAVQRRLSPGQEYAFTIDTTIELNDREAEVRLYVLPETQELTEALTALSAPRP
jgi:chemotaxis protein CheY-P-specific phosphatase CheC